MSQGDCRHRRTRLPQPSFGGTHRHRDAAPAHERADPPAVRAAFRFALSFENNDLTHAPFRLKLAFVRRGPCMSSTLTVRRIVADGRRVRTPRRIAARAAARRSAGGRLLSKRTRRRRLPRSAPCPTSRRLSCQTRRPSGRHDRASRQYARSACVRQRAWVAHAVRHLRGVLLLETATAWLAERGAGRLRVDCRCEPQRDPLLRAGGFRQYRRTRADRTDARRDEIAVRIADEALT